MKHRTVVIIMLLTMCTIVAGCALDTPENRTIRYFNSHRTVLEEDISRITENGQVACSLDITFNYWNGDHPIVEYIVVRRGVVPSARYYGFFYSFDDTPVSFQNAGEALTSVSEQEWKWAGEGDNHGIVRRLDTNWFYFEASL